MEPSPFWNPESTELESGIRNPQGGIQNPGLSWIPLHGANAMLCHCSSYLQKTKNSPPLNGEEEVGVWILLFSEVNLFEYNVSNISSLIVSLVIDLFFLDDHDLGEL